MTETLSFAALTDEVAAGKIDTDVVAMADMIGRRNFASFSGAWNSETLELRFRRMFPPLPSWQGLRGDH